MELVIFLIVALVLYIAIKQEKAEPCSSFLSSAEDRARQAEFKQALDSFLENCIVSEQVTCIEDIVSINDSPLALAYCTDGRRGIVGLDGWLHLGSPKYIASKWGEYGGIYPGY